MKYLASFFTLSATTASASTAAGQLQQQYQNSYANAWVSSGILVCSLLLVLSFVCDGHNASPSVASEHE